MTNFKKFSNQLDCITTASINYINDTINGLDCSRRKLLTNSDLIKDSRVASLSSNELAKMLIDADHHSNWGLDCGFTYIDIYKTTNAPLVKELCNIMNNLKKVEEDPTITIPKNIMQLSRVFSIYSYSTDKVTLVPKFSSNVQSVTIKEAELRPLVKKLNVFGLTLDTRLD